MPQTCFEGSIIYGYVG
uniref:Uncharacterized protein n=1 Tax=Rhizophora mucronata TaxID=61149 RepID=A0A2P2Q732_RHIMU